MPDIKVMDEVSIIAKDKRYVYKLQQVIHNRENEHGVTETVSALRIAYWKNGKYKQDPPIMLEEELIALVVAGARHGLFKNQKLTKVLRELVSPE